MTIWFRAHDMHITLSIYVIRPFRQRNGLYPMFEGRYSIMTINSLMFLIVFWNENVLCSYVQMTLYRVNNYFVYRRENPPKLIF